MNRLHIRCLLTGVVCFLVISLLYFVVCQDAFPAVCIAFTLAAVFISYNYQISNHLHIPLAPNRGSFCGGDNSVHLQSDHSSTPSVTRPFGWRRPGAITNAKAPLVDYSSTPNLARSGYYDPSRASILGAQQKLRGHGVVTNGRTLLLPDGTEPISNGVAGLHSGLSPCAVTDHNSVHSQSILQQLPSQFSEYIPVLTSKGEHLNNRSLGEDIRTANGCLGGDFLPQSVIEDRRYESPGTSPTVVLPKFKHFTRSDNTPSELIPHADHVSRSTANEIVAHPTHQSQFGSLGILPLVHLPEAPRTFSNVHSSRSLSHGLVTVKIAPPDPLIAPVQFIRSENVSPPSLSSKSCLTGVLNALTEKRKRTAQCDETLETGTSFYHVSNKRRKLDDTVEPASSSSPPVIATSCSGGLNLKRPALRDISTETDTSKHRRLQPYAVPSSTCQPGASARNPIEASYTSSNRWLSRKALNVDLKVAPDICQDASRSSLVETEPKSPLRHHSRESELIHKSFSESQMMTSDEEELHFPGTPCESSLTILQPSSGRSSPIYASLDKGQPDDNSRNNLNLSKRKAKNDRLPYKAYVPTSSEGKFEGYPVQSSSYRTHLTIEDIERDRQKEMERVKHMLGEASELFQDAEPEQPMPYPVLSSAPVNLSAPHAAISASGVPFMASSSSSAVEHLSISTTAPSLQQQTSASAAVVYSASSPTESTIPCSDLPSSLGSPLHSQVLSAATPNPPVSLNSESISQSCDTTSAASVTLTSPEITTFGSPTCQDGGSCGGFKFNFVALSKTSFSGLSANRSSVSNAVGGFKFEPSKKSVSAMDGSKFPHCFTSGEKVCEIASMETIVSQSTASTKPSVFSASANLAAAFGFGQTTNEPALSSNRPQTSTIASTAANSVMTYSATDASAGRGFAVQTEPVFKTVSQSVGPFSKSTLDQSLAINKMSSVDFLNNISRNEASKGFENPSSMNTSFTGMFGCSVTNSNASMSSVAGIHSSTLNSTVNSSLNPTLFGKPVDGNPVTGMIFNSKGFLPAVAEKNQSLVTAFGDQQALVNNSVFESQQKASSNAGNQRIPEQGFGACTTSWSTLGTLPALGISFGNQPTLPFSFGSQPAVKNSSCIEVTTATLFNNQSTSVNSVLSTPMTSLNSFSNSKASIFPFSGAAAVNLPSYSQASVPSFGNPTSVKSPGISHASLFPIFNPTVINSLSSPETSFSTSTSLNLIGSVPQATNQFSNLGNNSASGFGGLPSQSNMFGNREQTSLNPCGRQQTVSFNFGAPTTVENAFGNQTTSAFSFGNHSAVTNILSNHGGDQIAHAGGFGSSFGFTAPSCVAEPKTLFSGPLFSQTQFQFPSGQSGGIDNSSVFNPAFKFSQNLETASAVTSAQTPSPFSFGQSSGHSFNFAQNATPSSQQLPNNPPTSQQGQLPSQLNQFSPPQPQFASQLLWTPRFSIGTDNSNTAKYRSSSIKNRMRRKQ